MSDTQSYKKITLSLSDDQMGALKRGNVLRIYECESMLGALHLTQNEKTPLADYWRGQMKAAQDLQMQVSRAPASQDLPSLDDLERANMIVALEDRVDELKKQIAENEKIGWTKFAADSQKDLDAVRALLKRLGVA